MKGKCFRRGPEYTREYGYSLNSRTEHSNLKGWKESSKHNWSFCNEVVCQFNGMKISVARFVKFGLLDEKTKFE